MYAFSIICTSNATVNLKYLIQSNSCHFFRHISVVKLKKIDSVKNKSAIETQDKKNNHQAEVKQMKLLWWEGWNSSSLRGSVLPLPQYLNS